MDLLIAWLAFPGVLALLCLGSGLAVEALVRVRLPAALVPGVGLAALIVVGEFLTLEAKTAALAPSAAVASAAAGLALAVRTRWPLRRPGPIAVVLAGVFAIYAAPIVLSGEATIAGFIKLDDTATWLAFTDQVMADGRDLSELAPSTHEATLKLNVGEGYPLGAFIPLGIGSELLATDPAWLVQPYMAVAAALFALAAWSLTAPLVASPWARAGIAFVAAQPALAYGYYLWGGIKELLAAALIATAAALVPLLVAGGVRTMVPLAVVCSALIGVLSGGGAVWLVGVLLVALIVLARSVSAVTLAARAGAFAVGVALLSLPVLLPGGLLPPTSSPLDADDARGNLLSPLDPLQIAGIWPAGDFRLGPHAEPLAYALAGLALALAAVGVAWAWSRRAHGIVALAVGGGIGCAALVLAGSPWVDGKALATASPAVLLAALVGAAAFGRVGMAVGAILAAGVLWSNALAYRDVSLAPRDQLAELEEIGEEIAGEGPTLMTEYSPYGARHFLRAGDPEAVSELRRRRIPLANGRTVPKGLGADTDALDRDALWAYRTLVLRRSPAQSRPPGGYGLVWQGHHYEVWQRRRFAIQPSARIGLGSRLDPTAIPRCRAVRSLAASGQRLAAATGSDPIVVSLADGHARLGRAGVYEVWLRGSVRPAAAVLIDGEAAGEARHQLNNAGQYVSFGEVELGAGSHRVELHLGGADLHPGSGGAREATGPIVLTRSEAADSRLVRVRPEAAERLCGREWDWIETASTPNVAR